MTAEGAALGLKALGSTDEAGALGLMEFGPVAAGAEPGIGTKTPCAVAAWEQAKAATKAKTHFKTSRPSCRAGYSRSHQGSWPRLSSTVLASAMPSRAALR